MTLRPGGAFNRPAPCGRARSDGVDGGEKLWPGARSQALGTMIARTSRASWPPTTPSSVTGTPATGPGHSAPLSRFPLRTMSGLPRASVAVRANRWRRYRPAAARWVAVVRRKAPVGGAWRSYQRLKLHSAPDLIPCRPERVPLLLGKLRHFRVQPPCRGRRRSRRKPPAGSGRRLRMPTA